MTKETKKRQDIAAPQTGWNCAVRLFNLNKVSFNSTICPLCQATVSSHSWSYIVNGAVEKAGCFLDSGRPYTQICSEHFHHSAHRPSAADQSAHFVLPWPISVFSEELVHTLVPISVVIDEELFFRFLEKKSSFTNTPSGNWVALCRRKWLGVSDRTVINYELYFS